MQLPGWPEIVTTLEHEANLKHPAYDGSLPERLEVVYRALKVKPFQQALRQSLLCSLATSVIKAALQYAPLPDPVPIQVRQLARLGTLANPIVNFNIETLTSSVIASPGGPFWIKCFTPPVPALGYRFDEVLDRQTLRVIIDTFIIVMVPWRFLVFV
jgi:hypothetical protein